MIMKKILFFIKKRYFFSRRKKQAQIFIEFLWLVIFIFGFLTSAYYLFEKAENKIETYRFGKMK